MRTLMPLRVDPDTVYRPRNLEEGFAEICEKIREEIRQENDEEDSCMQPGEDYDDFIQRRKRSLERYGHIELSELLSN